MPAGLPGRARLTRALAALGFFLLAACAAPAGAPPSATPPVGIHPTAPANHIITASAYAPDGSFWYAFDAFDDFGGASMYAQRQGLFHLRAGQFSRYPLEAVIRVIQTGPDGRVYVGAGCGVVRIAGEQFETLLPVECGQQPPEVTRLFPLDFAFTPDGALWVGGAYSLARYADQRWVEYLIPAARVAAAPDGAIWAHGWDGRTEVDCCLTRLSAAGWVTYTVSADMDLPLPAEVRAHLLNRDIGRP